MQKAAPKSWFSAGQRIHVENCATRFGPISWTTEAGNNGRWKVNLALTEAFAGDLHVHIHASDGRPLRGSSLGTVEKIRVLVPSSLLAQRTTLEIDVF
ncbi:hypothetical protein [Occallatibacter riparius]|uniref:Uncharacterized protein n=1 Tax=Occallatibacter riparius TaxID=1002689 RepID=A0A9J7BJR8_9BACT|nr:hypothetical protein [Occallatibacter riparius]UWZ82787.1 hypothetical protein MOP44_19715 [Occallatibacter riparius]